MSLPGYDQWKLASPPEYDMPTYCAGCGAVSDGEAQCPVCGYGEPDGTDEDEPDRDDAREAEAHDDAR